MTERSTFSGDPLADYVIDIDDGGSQGADGGVTLNGEVLLAPRTIGDVGPRHVRRGVTLSNSNTLDVRLTGKPGSTLTISILGGVKIIGGHGGTVALPGGAMTLIVPEGAIETPTEVRIVPLANYSPPLELGLGPTGPAWRLEPAGLRFATSITVHVAVETLGPSSAGAALSDLRFAHFSDDGSKAQVIEPRTFEPEQSVEFEISHFSSLVTFLFGGGFTDPEKRWATLGLQWDVRAIKWYLEPPSEPTILTVPEIEAAFAQWQAVSNLRFEKIQAKEDAQIVFVEERNLSWTVLGPICLVGSSVYGQTCFPFFAGRTLQATDTVTVHMASEGVNTPEFEFDIRSSLLHEIGHALGLAHTPSDFWLALPDPAANKPVMGKGDIFPLTLRQPDIAAIQYLYGAKAIDDQYQMTQGTTLTVPAPGVLANDIIAKGFSSVLYLNPPQGFSDLGAGAFSYSPPSSIVGAVQFSYSIQSGSVVSEAATVTVQVNPALPSQLQISSGNNQVGSPGTILPNAISVVSIDQFGNPVGLVPVTFRVKSGGGCISASPTGTNCQSELARITNATSGPLPGRAGVFWRLGALAGTQTLEVVSLGVPNITFTATAIAPPNPSSDNFDDNSLNANLWRLSDGIVGTVAETNQRLEMIPSGPVGTGVGLISKWSLTGDFDIQVDYALLGWPAGMRQSLQIRAADLGSGPFGSVSLSRYSDPTGELYVMNFGTSYVPSATTNTAGTLRLVRTGSTLNGYIRSATTWHLVGSGTVSGAATRISLEAGPATFGTTRVAFDNFRINLPSPFLQQGPKLVAMDAVGNAGQGISVSISGDGNTAIVGGLFDNAHVGAAWIWARSGGVWSQQGNKLTGSNAVGTAFQGGSVSISADGNTAIVGGDGDNSFTGAAWIWTRSAGIWTQQAKLIGSDAVGNARQGYSVSISGDGNTAIVGGLTDNGKTGAAWIWTRSNGVWTQQGTKLVGSGHIGNAFFQGGSVSLSSDGKTAIVGGAIVLDNSLAVGAAWIWTRNGDVWAQQQTGLVGAATAVPVIPVRQVSVSLSADGNTAMVGRSGAWVWTRNGGVWSQQGTELVGTDAVGNAGQVSVSLSADGNRAIVGSPLDNALSGAAWVWTRSAGVWTQLGTKLVGSAASVNASQGHSVSLSGDSNTAIVGGPNENGNAGAAWIFITSTLP